MISFNFQIKRTEQEEGLTRLEAPKLLAHPGPWELTFSILNPYRMVIEDYEFYAVHVKERPLASSIGSLRIKTIYTGEEIARIREARDALNEILRKQGHDE